MNGLGCGGTGIGIGTMSGRKVERKLTTILAADVVGFTRLMRTDEEATLVRFGAYRAVIDTLVEQHGGRIFNTAGDSVAAEFASPVEAVRCAMAWQQEIAARNADVPEDRRLNFRIGINVGDVMVRNGDLYGDGVNVAARLEALAQPHGICVSANVLEQIRHKLPVGIDDLGSHEVKNIAEPISVFRLVPGRRPDDVTSSAIGLRAEYRRVAATAAVLLLGVAAGIAVWHHWPFSASGPAADTLPRPLKAASIAVLPFSNLSADPKQEYFVDGMTDDLIVELTKVRNLLVISRDSSFRYKQQRPDIREFARTLNVRYVLTGSVRRSESAVRINARLIDASGQLLWGEHYDGDLDNIFALQDQITRKIISALSIKLSPKQIEAIKRTEVDDPRAYDLFLRGRAQFFSFSKDGTKQAQGYLGEALQLAPEFAQAYSLLAWTYVFEFMNGWSERPERSLDRALALADKGLNLNPAQPIAHFVKGLAYRERRESPKALAESIKATEIDPNYANGHVLLATILYYGGRPEEGLQRIKRAMRLNPHHPSNYPFHLGQALFTLRRYEEAAAAFEDGLKTNPSSQRLHVWLAAAYAQLGRTDDARWEVDQVLASDPNFSLERTRRHYPFSNEEDLEHLIASLQKAGFREARGT